MREVNLCLDRTLCSREYVHFLGRKSEHVFTLHATGGQDWRLDRQDNPCCREPKNSEGSRLGSMLVHSIQIKMFSFMGFLLCGICWVVKCLPISLQSTSANNSMRIHTPWAYLKGYLMLLEFSNLDGEVNHWTGQFLDFFFFFDLLSAKFLPVCLFVFPIWNIFSHFLTHHDLWQSWFYVILLHIINSVLLLYIHFLKFIFQ